MRSGFHLVGGSTPFKPLVRLVCFHHGGGSPEAYVALRGVLPATWSTCCVRLARDGAEATELIKAVAAELERDSVPKLLFGHSSGALLAYRVGAELDRRSKSPTCTVLSSCAPRISDSGAPIPSFWELLYDMIYLGGLPRSTMSAEAAVRYAVSAYEHDLRLSNALRAMEWPTLGHPLAYFHGIEDESVPDDAASGWAGASGQNPAVYRFPGRHFYFVGPGAARLAEALVSVEHATRVGHMREVL